MRCSDSSGDESSLIKRNIKEKCGESSGTSSNHFKVITKRRKTESTSQTKLAEKRWSVAESEVEAEVLEDMGVGKLSEGSHWYSEASNSSCDSTEFVAKTQTFEDVTLIFAHPAEKTKNANTTVEGDKLTTPDNSQESPFICTKEEIDFFLYRRKTRVDQPRHDEFARLSDEIILLIFSLMPKSMLIQSALVCKRWQRISYDETLWTRLDLSSRRLNVGAMGYVLSRGTHTLRLAQTEFTDPIFLDESTEEIFKLQYLDLSMACISETGLCSLIRSCRHLKKLSLEHCTVNDEVCSAIAKNANLTVLNMSGCYGVTSYGVEIIALGCRKITEWNLAWTGISELGVEVLIEEISDTIQKLNISGFRKCVSDFHVGSLVANCPNLTELDLSDCTNLRELSIEYILRLEKLECLALSRCYNIPVNSLRRFDDMESLKSLEVFSIITEPTTEVLQKSLPGVAINKNVHSQIARPTVGIRRTSIWSIRVRE